MRILIINIVIFAFLLVACKNKQSTITSASANLLKYGIADEIYPPKEAIYTPMKNANLIGVSIAADSMLEVQAFMTASFTKDYTKLITDRKREIVGNPYFVKIVEENNQGFLFEKKISETEKSYDFRVVKLIGDNEVTYQSGIKKEYTEAEAKEMMSWVLSR